MTAAPSTDTKSAPSVSIRPAFDLPRDKGDALRQAKRLEWISIFFIITIIAVMGITMGSSQTMKAAWVEDALSLVPPAVFLVGSHWREKPPSEEFPYGTRKAVSLAFLASALTLAGFGAYILVDSVMKLITQEHASIGTATIFGRQIWMGWVMIAALVYSVIPPMILGRKKLPLATQLSEKALHTDAEMNRADWLTGIAGVFGIMGIAFGWWWADGVAAGTISFDIVKDGFANVRHGLAELMDNWPTSVESKEHEPVGDKVKEELEALDWVEHADVRLRQEGDVLTGEAFVVPRDEDHLMDHLAQARDKVLALDWRLYEVLVVPVASINREKRAS